MIEIAECNVYDLGELSNLWELMIKEVMPESTPKKDWWINYIKSFMVHSDYKCYKAVNNGIVVGFIDGTLFADPSLGKITAIGLNFYVRPEYRGIVGTRLFLRLVREGKKRGAEFVDLICYKNSLELWNKFNMDSIRYVVRKAL